jgi:uncharacterized protein YqeY
MLKEKIDADLLKAIKSEAEIERTTLRFLNAAIINKEKEKRYSLIKADPSLKEEDLAAKCRLTDEEIVAVVFSEVKKREEAAGEYQKGNRPELAEKEKAEAGLLSRYLPEQLTEDKIRKIVASAISSSKATSVKDMGKIMGIVLPQTKGKADGKTISRIVGELLPAK